MQMTSPGPPGNNSPSAGRGAYAIRVRPLTYGEPRCFDTIPSQPSLQAWR